MTGTVKAVAVIGARDVLKGVRTPMLITASLLQPIIWMVLFSQTFKGLADTPQFRALGYTSYLMFLVPGMLVLSMLFTALQSGMATVTDIDTGMMDKFLIGPIRRSTILLAA
jgi:ABC-2 type transport system permease protein